MTIPIRIFEPASEGARRFLAQTDKKLLIDGAWVAAASGATFTTFDPATGKSLAELAAAGAADIDAAVSSARQAFEGDAWRGMTPSARGKLLWRIADLIDAHVDELAELETLDQENLSRPDASARSPPRPSSFAITPALPPRSSARRSRPPSATSRRARRYSPTRRASRSGSSLPSRRGTRRC